MPAASLDTTITHAEFRVILGFNNSIGDLNEKKFKTGTSLGDTKRFYFVAALVVARAVTRPRNEILNRREHGHIDADFSDNGNGGHRILVEARNGVNQVKRLETVRQF